MLPNARQPKLHISASKQPSSSTRFLDILLAKFVFITAKKGLAELRCF